MKKLYSTLLLAAITATTASAQINLKATISSPTNGQNAPVNTSFNLDFEFKNLGPASVLATDTLLYRFTGDGGNTYFRTGMVKNVGDTFKFSRALTVNSGSGNSDVCVIGYVFRAGQRVETDTADNQTCRTIHIQGLGVTNITENKAVRQAMNIVPNPASASIKLDFKAITNAPVVARVLDVTGREMLRQDYGMQYNGAENFNINISSLSPGMYMVELVQDNVRAVGRFIRK